MSERDDRGHRPDRAPGEEDRGPDAVAKAVRTYVVGFAGAVALTVASFVVLGSPIVYAPAIPVALVALAVAQMGVHLVFFLHVTSGPDNLNNVLALAFGVLIVGLVMVGSLWIMANLDHQLMPMGELMKMQR